MLDLDKFGGLTVTHPCEGKRIYSVNTAHWLPPGPGPRMDVAYEIREGEGGQIDDTHFTR